MTTPIAFRFEFPGITVTNRFFEDIKWDPTLAHFRAVFIIDIGDDFDHLKTSIAKPPHALHKQTAIRFPVIIEKRSYFVLASNPYCIAGLIFKRFSLFCSAANSQSGQLVSPLITMRYYPQQGGTVNGP
jgi:hypothetical protein